jgi:hypothetical protein
MWQTPLKFLLGAIAGTLLWWHAAPQYDQFVARCGAVVLRADARLRDIDAAERDRWTLLRSASGAFPTALIPTDQLTYNVILFIALLATRRGLLRRRNLRVAVAGIVVMFVVHVLAFAIVSESTYSMAQGQWSDRHYDELAQNAWLYAAMFYRLIAMFAVPFGVWWLLREPER